MGVFVDSEQKLIFESFWLRFGSICLHFSSRVPLLHATPPTFCLSDFTTPTILFVWYYNSKLFHSQGLHLFFVCLSDFTPHFVFPILQHQFYTSNFFVWWFHLLLFVCQVSRFQLNLFVWFYTPNFLFVTSTPQTFLFVSFYTSKFFVRLIWHFFIVNIALPDASVLCNFWFYIVASSMNQNLGREQKGFIKGTFISFQSGFAAAEARVINSGLISIVPSQLPFLRSRFPRWRTFSMFSFLFFFCINLEKNSKAG